MRSPLIVSKRNAAELIDSLMPVSRLLAWEAFRLGYDISLYQGRSMFRVSDGMRFFDIAGTLLPFNSMSAYKISENKFYTNMILAGAGIPVPSFTQVKEKMFRSNLWSMAGVRFPVVVKPAAGTYKGVGVITNIRDKKTLVRHLRDSFKKHKGSMLVEEYHKYEHDYRVLVLDGKVIAVTRRIPAYVIGDGNSTIRTLIEKKNQTRKQFEPIPLSPIEIDTELRSHLQSQRLTLRTRPKEGHYIKLKNVSNFGAGGEAENVTNKICKANKDLAVKAARLMNLRFAGIDILCSDIGKSITRTGGVIVELNARPGFYTHLYPTIGRPNNVACKVIRALFSH